MELFTSVNDGDGFADQMAYGFSWVMSGIGDDPTAAFMYGAEQNLSSWSRPGALDEECGYPSNTFPGWTLRGRIGALFNLDEAVVQDLAKATGQEPALALNS